MPATTPPGLSPAWFGLVGLFLGTLCTMGGCAALFFWRLAAMHTQISPIFGCLLAGLVWLMLEIWLTRGLHWDGLADVGDALGSGARGEKFWQILHDSRLGSFGLLTLLICFLLQWLAVACHYWQMDSHGFLTHSLKPACILILAVGWSRYYPIWLAWKTPVHAHSSLGTFFHSHLSAPALYASICFAACVCMLLVLMGMPLWQIAPFLLLQIMPVAYLRKKCLEHGGISGDFMGASIELSQAFFLSCAIFPV